MTITSQDITRDLLALGIPSGAKVLVHSSLSSLGQVEGGADAVIDALLAAVGPSGTVIVPTLTGDQTDSPQIPPRFNPRTTPTWAGRIPETFRQRPDAMRSLHPTHSVAAIGLVATTLTSYHIASITPCDELSPYGRLADLDDSFILLLGVDHAANTTLHHVEELVGVPYHIQPGFACAVLEVNGQPIERHYLLHRWDVPRNFNVMEPVFLERGIQRNGAVGQAQARLVKTKEMVIIARQCLMADPTILRMPQAESVPVS